MQLKVLAVAGTLMVGASTLMAADQTFTGFVSDAHCGAAHSAPSDAATACVQKCIKAGNAPVLVMDGKVYQLAGNTAKVAKHAGENVTVKGTESGDTITVSSVKAAK